MSSAQNKVLIVVAAGPLIGITTAAVFATKGFTHIALIARNTAKLNILAEAIPTSVITKTYSADVSKPDNLTATLEQISTDFGAPEVVLYNGAVISGGALGEQTEDEILNELKVSTLGLYTTAKWAMPFLQTASPTSKPTFLVTGGGIWKDPNPARLSLSLNKAAQYNLAMSLAKVYEPRGVHVAVLVVNDIVYPEKGDPQTIAEKFWEMYIQEKGQWTRSENVLQWMEYAK